MQKIINFSLPGIYENFLINCQLLNLYQTHKVFFYDNINLNTVYGTFPHWIFDGGRVFDSTTNISLNQVKEILDIFNNKYKVKIRLLCTNPIVSKHFLNNTFFNDVLQICENSINEIAVNNILIEKYIQQHYPLYTFTSSTTKCITNLNELKIELKKYKMVCLDYNFNNNWEILKELNNQERLKCEFIVNPICPPKCQFRKQHYISNGLYNLSYGKIFHQISNCPIKTFTTSYENRSYQTHINNQDIYNKYFNNSFFNFKIEGRNLPQIETILNYSYYLIKPIYHDEFIQIMYNYIK